MHSLKQLFLQDNEIMHIDKNAFTDLINLEILMLTNNKLSYLPENWDLPLTNLKILELNKNSFNSFESLSLNINNSRFDELFIYLSMNLNHIRFNKVPKNATLVFSY